MTYWNCFGFDRSAALFYFAAPRVHGPGADGQEYRSLIFIYLEVLVLSAVTVVLRMGIGGRQIVETLRGDGDLLGVHAGVGKCIVGELSAAVASGAGLTRVRRGISGILVFALSVGAGPRGLAYLARYAFQSQLAFAAVLGLAAVIAAVLYKISLDSAVATATLRREFMMGELTKGEGPLVSG